MKKLTINILFIVFYLFPVNLSAEIKTISEEKSSDAQPSNKPSATKTTKALFIEKNIPRDS